ncbi:hypothetical protein PG987_015835 [Apiospora arundinis]
MQIGQSVDGIAVT